MLRHLESQVPATYDMGGWVNIRSSSSPSLSKLDNMPSEFLPIFCYAVGLLAIGITFDRDGCWSNGFMFINKIFCKNWFVISINCDR